MNSKTISYIKIILPLAVMIGLFSFKNYFLGQMSDYISASNKNTTIPKYFEDYDFSKKNTPINGTLLEFGALNCSACRQMELVLNDIKEAYKKTLAVHFINITEKDGIELGRQFGVVMIPTQVLLDKDGRVVYKHVGYISTSDISTHIETKVFNDK